MGAAQMSSCWEEIAVEIVCACVRACVCYFIVCALVQYVYAYT